MKEYDYIIVGSGLYGSILGKELKDSGKKCLVLEKRDHVGGNIYTQKIEDIYVHKYGAHIFHTDNKEVWDYINKLGEFNRFTNSPMANYRGEMYNLPFNMNTFYQMWGVSSPEKAKEIIEEQKKEANIDTPKNLKEQAISLVGSDIYNKLICGYTQKQWGRKCEELPAFIIKRLPVRFTYDNNYFNSRYQGIPINGYTAIIENLLAGIEVKLNTDFFTNREKWLSLGEKIVYTGPIDQFYEYKLGALQYRKVRFETEVLDTENFQGSAVVNYTDLETPYTRIIEHKHFTSTISPKTVVSYEFSDEWQKGDEPYYPLNDDKNSNLYNEYRSLADLEENIIFGGRLGEYKYYDMDKVIEKALEMVKKLI